VPVHADAVKRIAPLPSAVTEDGNATLAEFLESASGSGESIEDGESTETEPTEDRATTAEPTEGGTPMGTEPTEDGASTASETPDAGPSDVSNSADTGTDADDTGTDADDTGTGTGTDADDTDAGAVEPVAASYAPGTGVCADCGERAVRLWRDGDGYVCPACKGW